MSDLRRPSTRTADTPAPRPASQSRIGPWLLVIALAAAVPYVNTLGAAFTFDDHGLVIENPMATPGMSAWQWVGRPSSYGSLFRPITMITYAANAGLGGGPTGYHLANVTLHVLTTLVAFAFAGLVLAPPAARLVALIFAVHPVHTEAVASIAGRAELLAGLFALLCLVSFVQAGRGQRHRLWTVAALLSFGLAVLSKESGFAALGLLGLMSWWDDTAVRPLYRLRRLVPFVLLAIGCLALRYVAVGALTLQDAPLFFENPLAHVNFWSREGTALLVLGDYLSLLAVPLVLSADYSFNQVPIVTALGDPRLVAAVGVLLALGTVCVATRRRAPVLGFAAIFSLIAISLTANVIFPIGTIKAERLLYLPSLGWCLACGWLLTGGSPEAQRWRRMIAATLIIALAGRTWVRNRDWHDDGVLFAATVAASPDSARAQSNVATILAQRGDLKTAQEYYTRAVEIYPRFTGAAIGLALIAESDGRVADALHWYAEALASDPTQIGLYVRRGQLLLAASDAAGAEGAFRDGLARAPGQPDLMLGLATARLAQGDRPGADALLEEVDQQSGTVPAIRQRADEIRHAMETN